MTAAPTTRAGSPPEQGGEPSHRARLLDALGASIEERGYRATTVADIVRMARTSRRTFYQEFATKEACFIELLQTANTDMIGDIVAAVDPDSPWRSQIRQAIEAYVRSIEARPALTLSWIRELPALGPAARPVQRRAMEDFIQTLIALTDTDHMHAAGISTISRSLALLMLGGLRELTAVAVEDGQPVSDTTETMVDACVALLLPR
ncbi:TetR family transcriptional regulator [Williamsia limnetica]|uniref:TetR family transcriptional regulator n=1 Tax=Williamsia limnetica TaxID=882452 RepID=A0A318RNZ2_WILLI|nr:TetR/AcrR family transcriptional regulator [Williamsia limnetica]PYE16463.1 TetR family transcriptional regulator [Williamsia limnetica]